MSTRTTRSRAAKAAGDDAQTLMKDYFKTTRKGTRTRSEKKVLNDDSTLVDHRKAGGAKLKEEIVEKPAVKSEEKVAPIFEKPGKVRARTPTRESELFTKELSGSPPKKCKENGLPDVVLSAPETDDLKPNDGGSAIDELIKGAVVQKKKKQIKTVADLQARLAAKGSVNAIHEQNMKNKIKKVDDHVEVLKSPTKKLVQIGGYDVKKSKAVRSLIVRDSVPDYILPVQNIEKSAEKIREEKDNEFENEVERRTAEFMKSSRLIDEVKNNLKSGIELPKSYENLANAFQHVDRIVSIIISQNRSCVAAELFKNIKNTTQKDFSSRHLSQILTVYPQSYHVEMREQWRAFGGSQSGKYELEIKPNLIDDLQQYLKEETLIGDNLEEIPLVKPGKLMSSPMKSPRKGVSQPMLRKPELDQKKRLDAARMRDRSYVFRYLLNEIVKSHYAKFLKENGIEMSPKLKRMHPLFEVNKHCPPVAEKELPQPPISKNKTHVGMREYMKMNMDTKQVELPPTLNKTIDDLKSPVKNMTGASGSVPLSPKKFADMQAEQKSKGAKSLLERIRAREASRKAAESCIDEDLKLRKSRLTLLDNRYLRTLCSLYATKKSQSMEFEVVAEKLVFSCSVPTSKSDVISHLELLCSIAENYVTQANVMGKRYLRIVDNNYNAISELVKDELQKANLATEKQRVAIENAQKTVLSNDAPNSSLLTPRPFSPKTTNAARSLKFI